MSNFAATVHMTDTATVWDVTGTNEFAQPSYGAPYLIKCNFFDDGKLQRDQNGDEFMPNGAYRTFDARPKIGSVIRLGDHTANAAPNGVDAYTVKKAVTKTPFRSWQKRYTYYTG